MRDSSIIISLVPFDGHPFALAVETLAEIGIQRIEPALIAGYTDPFDEAIFTTKLARSWRSVAAAAGLRCAAFSAHVDIGAPGGAAQISRRLRFAAELGAKRLVTNAAAAEYREEFFCAMERLILEAQRYGVIIALENPGNGRPNLIDSAQSAAELVARFGSPWVSLNYDPGNLLTHQPGLRPEEDVLSLDSQVLGSLHLKNAALGSLAKTAKGAGAASTAAQALGAALAKGAARVNGPDGYWRFVPLCAGVIDYRKILAHTDKMVPRPEYCIELPLRLRREFKGTPHRATKPVKIQRIRKVLVQSLEWLEAL